MELESRDNIIMNLLEENGLDKRFRENPEAVKQICNLFLYEINQTSRKEISSRDEFVQIARIVLERQEGDIGNDGKRYWTTFSIAEDGSLDVKQETKVTDYAYGRSERIDMQKVFAIGEKREELVVTERGEELTKCRGNALARVSLLFRTFNKHGLEMARRELRQSINNSDTTKRISNCKNAFYIGRSQDYELGPVKEDYLSRGKNLVTQNYRKTISEDVKILVFEMDSIMKRHQKEDNLVNPLTLIYDFDGTASTKSTEGQVLNSLAEYDIDELYGVTDYKIDTEAKLTKEEREAKIQWLYSAYAKKSTAFRRTLIEEAKTNPDLQKVVEQLGLDKNTTREETVTVSDLQRAYESVSAPEIKDTMQSLLEASKAEDKEKDTEDIMRG